MSPEALPQPPNDPAALADFPALAEDRLPHRLYRVHRHGHGPELFASGGQGRWDPPLGSLASFGTCYTSTSALGAYLETFAQLPLLTQGELERRLLSTIQPPPLSRWADMTEGAIVGRWHLDDRINTGSDYQTCQRWAERLAAAGFDGIHYAARHDVTLATDTASVALFGSPGYQPGSLRVASTTPIPPAVVFEAERRFHIVVLPDTLLGPSGP